MSSGEASRTRSGPAGQVSGPLVLTTGAAIQAWVRERRSAGLKVGLVPTMGALHEGHLSLVRAARRECDCVVTTIFVNPTQFGPNEDFQKYPRTFEADLALLRGEGVEAVFAPDRAELYPEGFSTYVDPPSVAEPLEGRCRPGHFRGVATVVLKLFLLIPADVAFFGRKDFQQASVIRRMTADLNVPMRIVVCPTVRELDGLAMSSRNRYLSVEERERALALSRGLKRAAAAFASGERGQERLSGEMLDELRAAGISQIEYAVVADPDTLESAARVGERAVALIAARVGTTRLIDNCELPAPADEWSAR